MLTQVPGEPMFDTAWLETSAGTSAIYPDARSLTAALGAGADFDLDFPNSQYAMLRWPYDLHATPAGAIALGAGGTASLAGNVTGHGFCALVRQIPNGAVVADMIAGLAASVRMPREVRKLDDIAPGAWIIAEVSGSFQLTLNVTYGYDLSWIRQVAGGALKGDIGLRVLTGLEAQLGCAANGEYVIAISRGSVGPEQQQIRVQLYQSRDGEWSAGMSSARITLTPVQTLSPQNFDELLKGVLGIQASQILNDLQQVEQWASAGLTGDKTQLATLEAEINQRLNLQQIQDALNAQDLSKLDPWMINRLEAFLGDDTPLTLKELEQLAQQLNKIAALKDTLYAKALQALQKQYAFALTANCQNSDSVTALIDLVFDFAANAGGAERGLALAIDGRFDEILLDTTNTGVLLNQGVLTHGIRRQSSVELALPFHDSTRSHVSNALATLNAVDQTGGRLIVYNGSYSDLVEVTNEWQSAVCISVAAGACLAPGVTIHNSPAPTYSYSLSAAVKQLTRGGLTQRFSAELEDYFPNTPIDEWLDALIGAGNTAIGDALVSLDVSLPPAYVLAWMKAPLDQNAPQYKTMSERLRCKFRAFLLEQYFAEAARYEDVADGSPVFTLLVFASDMSTADALLGLLGNIRETLDEASRGDLAGYYADDQASRIIASAASSPATALLYEGEAQIVESAKNAGLAMARFQASKFRNPAEALKQLAGFGAKVTSAFHGALETYATGDALLPLGTLLFAEAARAFDPTLASGTANAMFSLQVVKCSPFPPAGFPQMNAIAPADVLLESRFVNVPAVSAPGATNSRQGNRDSSARLLRA